METNNYQNLRFLIVDNIKPSQDILKQYVMRLTNRQVDSTHYAQDVASICQNKSYDVILLGYDLGENQKNGQQVLEELKVNRYINRHCIVILITAEISQEMVLAALEHKPDHYLCKPYSLNQLDKRLRSCRQKKKAMEYIYQALENDNPEQVIYRCKQALSINTPYKTECLGIVARQLFELEKFDEAKTIYEAHQYTANCQWATIGLGKVALHEKKLNHAEKLFKLLIRNSPLYLASYDWLAVTYEAQFHYLLAEEVLEQALLLSPRSITRLKKYAGLCLHNEHFDKATSAYESNYKLAHNSIHHCASNTIKYVQALVEYSPTLALVESKKMNNKAFSFIKQMTRDFKDADVKVQSHFLAACLLEITKEYELANDEITKGHDLLTIERDNIEESKLIEISKTLKKLNKDNLASQILMVNEEVKSPKTDEDSNYNKLNLKDKAQTAIELSLTLYAQSKYREAINKLQEAAVIFPKHIGIKFNLAQALLVSKQEKSIDDLDKAKKLLVELASLELGSKEQERLKKLQKKYQLIAGI